MPTYQYECPRCGATREVVRRITDDSSEICGYVLGDVCQETMKRVLGMPEFVLVGGGWGKDGYSKK